jgi:hypothetical protein
MAEHNTLTGASLHECKQISTAGTGDAGKVITPSAVDAGEGVLRNLTEAEISAKTYALTVLLEDLSSASVARVVVPFAGTLTTVYTVIDQAIATTDAVLTVAIDGVSTTPATVTIAFTGSAANDVDSVTITSNNTVVAGDVVTITSDGATATAANATCTLIFTKA